MDVQYVLYDIFIYDIFVCIMQSHRTAMLWSWLYQLMRPNHAHLAPLQDYWPHVGSLKSTMQDLRHKNRLTLQIRYFLPLENQLLHFYGHTTVCMYCVCGVCMHNSYMCSKLCWKEKQLLRKLLKSQLFCIPHLISLFSMSAYHILFCK